MEYTESESNTLFANTYLHLVASSILVFFTAGLPEPLAACVRFAPSRSSFEVSKSRVGNWMDVGIATGALAGIGKGWCIAIGPGISGGRVAGLGRFSGCFPFTARNTLLVQLGSISVRY